MVPEGNMTSHLPFLLEINHHLIFTYWLFLQNKLESIKCY